MPLNNAQITNLRERGVNNLAGVPKSGKYSRELTANPDNSLFQHEYGHYLQSQSYGLYYLQRYAIPSLIDAAGSSDHKQHAAEQDANIRAYMYFKEKKRGFNVADENGIYKNGKWRQGSCPINDYDWSLDYSDSYNQSVLKQGRIRPKWWDYVLGPFIIIPGMINVFNLKQ